MATAMEFLINHVDGAVSYTTTPGNYIALDLINDYLIWSKSLANHMSTIPTIEELNLAAEIISTTENVKVTKCLLMDFDDPLYHTHLVIGMGIDKQYPFCFSFDGATATEPQLEAWDSSAHTTFNKNVLGLGTANNSMVQAICTTLVAPPNPWTGIPLAGGTNVLLLNNGNLALPELGSGLISQELYCNLKIVIPQSYATPSAEVFVLTVRYCSF
jgi:hypothetical protein